MHSLVYSSVNEKCIMTYIFQIDLIPYLLLGLIRFNYSPDEVDNAGVALYYSPTANGASFRIEPEKIDIFNT